MVKDRGAKPTSASGYAVDVEKDYFHLPVMTDLGHAVQKTGWFSKSILKEASASTTTSGPALSATELNEAEA